MAAESAAEQAAEAAAQAPVEETEAWMAFLKGLVQPETAIERLGSCVLIILVSVVAYVVVMVLFHRAVRRVERETEEAVEPQRSRQQRIVTVLALLRSVAKWVIFIAAFVWVLAALGQPIGPLLAGAGVAGLAIGFGAQNLVRDVVSGFFLLLEGQYAVGDYVQIGALFGLVESIGVRTTVLKDLDNQHHHIPNGTIAAVTVYEEPFVNFVVETPIADPGQSAAAVEVVDEIIRELRAEYEHYLVHASEAGSIQRDDGALIRVPVAIFPTQEWMANEEIPQRVREVFARREIALMEGRDIRAYVDLERMPEYKFVEEADDDAERADA